MKPIKRTLAMLLFTCLLMTSAAFPALAKALTLMDPPQKVTEPTVVIEFEGDVGVSYTLHYKYRNVWLLPSTLTLESTKGSFTVDLAPGDNDFVLIESTQPRTSPDAVAFSIAYDNGEAQAAVPAAQPVTPAPSPTATASATPKSTQTPAASPTAQAEDTPEATAEPTPEETTTPEPTEEPTPEPTEIPVDMGTDRVLNLWMHGEDVHALQEGLLTLGFKLGKADGVYGPRTKTAVMRFQRKNDLKQDGLVGADTRAKLAELGVELPLYFAPDMTMPEGFERYLSIGTRGMDVYWLQEKLIELGYLEGKPDQVYGRRTRQAVRLLQRENGIKEDGIAGPDTLRLLFGMDAPEE